jgi:hypothetical protein
VSVFVMGLDLGQASDYTALTIIEEQPGGGEPVLHIRHLHRFALATPYPRIAEYVAGLLQREPLFGNADLAVDATGVGRPVIDLLRRYGCNPIPITITGGDSVTHDERGYHVPKRDLVSVLQVLLQQGRLKSAKLPGAEVLQAELSNFRVTVNATTGHDSYGAGPAGSWRDGEHDDLVLSCALACWYAVSSPGHVGGGWQRFAQAAIAGGQR